MAADASTNAKKTDLVFRRTFKAPLARVWRAWTDPEDIKRWWGPDGFTAPLARIDFREGGTSLLCMSSPAFGDQYSAWHYVKIVPEQRIEYVHTLVDRTGQKIDPVSAGLPEDFPQDQRQAVTFKALDAHRTDLTVTEFGWREGRMMELSRMGMEQCLEKMEALLGADRN